ncbi:MAG: hypothetical protein AAFZ58_11325 [Pseudomonadota bacterium]
MNLGNVTVALRPRSEWEAVDLGARMIRRDAAAIYATWFALTLPFVAVVLLTMMFTPYGVWAMFLYWWFEPVTDGPILHIVSRKLFGERTSWRAALAMTPRLAARNWIFLLTPLRLHFARSTALPVTQLEGLSGDARRRRAKVLNRRIFNFGTGVTVAYQHLVMCVYFGTMLIAVALIPPEHQGSLGGDWLRMLSADAERTSNIVAFLLIYTAQTALHPWFVGAGFGLYINCRTRLEAWDIEVAFRRMLQRRSGQLASAALIVLAMGITPLGAPAHAQAVAETTEAGTEEETVTIIGYWQDTEIKPAVESVMASDELSTERETTRWVKRDPSTPPTNSTDSDDQGNLFWNALATVLALIVEFGLWIGAALLLLLIIMTAKQWLPYVSLARDGHGSPDRILLADGEVSKQSLPADIPGTAQALWQRGDKRQALSLLFRGSVLRAVTGHGVRLPDSATEGDCLYAVRTQAGRDYASYFTKVVSAWMQCAYGAIDPDERQFWALCEQWPARTSAAS